VRATEHIVNDHSIFVQPAPYGHQNDLRMPALSADNKSQRILQFLSLKFAILIKAQIPIYKFDYFLLIPTTANNFPNLNILFDSDCSFKILLRGFSTLNQLQTCQYLGLLFLIFSLEIYAFFDKDTKLNFVATSLVVFEIYVLVVVCSFKFFEL
jgi:hypothetical protein